MVEARDVSSGRILEASSSANVELLMSTASLGCRVVDVQREVCYELCARLEEGWKRSVQHSRIFPIKKISNETQDLKVPRSSDEWVL